VNVVELALKKQLLQLQAASQREALATHVAGLTPLFEGADQIAAGGRWIRHHPEAVAATVVALAAARPGVRRFIWRWGRRSFFAWRLWRDMLSERAAPRRG
jgi:hypothetical protein